MGKFHRCAGSHVVVVWVGGTVMCLWRKREEIANASCTTVLLYHFQVDPEPVRHQVWDPFDPEVSQQEVQGHSAEASGGTTFNAAIRLFNVLVLYLYLQNIRMQNIYWKLDFFFFGFVYIFSPPNTKLVPVSCFAASAPEGCVSFSKEKHTSS